MRSIRSCRGEVPGLLGSLTARAEGQTIRMALIYALLDGAGRDRPRPPGGRARGMGVLRRLHALHLRRRHRGYHRGRHPARAAQRRRGRQDADRDLYAVQHNRRSGDIGRALELLMQRGKARSVTAPPPGRRGRPTETWYAI